MMVDVVLVVGVNIAEMVIDIVVVMVLMAVVLSEVTMYASRGRVSCGREYSGDGDSSGCVAVVGLGNLGDR